MIRTVFCSVLVVVACACAKNEEHTVTAPAATTDSVRKVGAPITATATVPLAKVLSEPDAFDQDTVLVDGAVRKVCSKKGCWMELATDAKGPGCRVTFKDYGFFVPTDSAGSTARVQGVVDVRTVPKEQVDHLEGEGAHFAAQLADGSAREVQIVASGVELRRTTDLN